MLFESDRWPDEIHISRALLPDELDKQPTAHVFFETHVPWLALEDGLPRLDSQASMDAD